ANGRVYQFSYTDSSCSGGTKETDPAPNGQASGPITCWTFDANNNASSIVYASGTSIARTLSYARDPTTGLVTSVTDSFTSGGGKTRTTSFLVLTFPEES